MRVELQTEGGVAFFPGLNKPVVVDSDDLPKKQAAQFQQLIDSTHFFDLPAASRSLPKGAAESSLHDHGRGWPSPPHRAPE